MPRKSRRKSKAEFPATEPTPLAAVLEPVAERLHLPEPITQPQLPAPAEPDRSDEAVSEFLDDRRKELVEPEPQSNGHGKHTAAILASRPKFTAPTNFMGVASFPQAGIRVSKSYDRRTAAIQFSDDKPLSRATEYDLMTAVQEAGFQYQPHTKQWERTAPEGMPLGQNVIEAVALAKEIAAARGAGRGR